MRKPCKEAVTEFKSAGDEGMDELFCCICCKQAPNCCNAQTCQPVRFSRISYGFSLKIRVYGFLKKNTVLTTHRHRKNPIQKKRKTAASKDYASAIISHVVQPRFQWCTISPRNFFLSQNDRYGARATHASEVVCGHEAWQTVICMIVDHSLPENVSLFTKNYTTRRLYFTTTMSLRIPWMNEKIILQ